MSSMATFLDRVWQSVSGTPGTGNASLSTAEPSYYALASAVGYADNVYYPYTLYNGNDLEWGWGYGTSSGTVWHRDKIIFSTNSNAAVSFSSGTKFFISPGAEDLASVEEVVADLVFDTIMAAYLGTVFRSVGRFADAFKTDTGFTGGSGYTYEDAEDLVTNRSFTTEENAAGPGASTAWSNTMFDRSFTLDSSAVITHIGVYSTAAGSGKVKIAERTGAGNYTIVLDEAITHPGTGLVYFRLSSPYTVPGSGAYHVGGYLPVTTVGEASSARGFKAGDVGTGAQTGFTETAGVQMRFVARYATVNDISLVTTTQETPANVSLVHAILEMSPLVAITLNTDVTIEMSCNNGTNYHLGVLTLMGVGPNGKNIYRSNDVKCTAGDDVKLRISTANGKAVDVHSLAARFS